MSNYSYKNIVLLNPPFESPVTDLIIELNFLRRKRLSGSTPATIFFQLKEIFHFLESLGSARIEGNHTTVQEFIESKIEKTRPVNEGIKEIQNGEDALAFIDKIIKQNKDFVIDEEFIKELHKRVVKDLALPPNGEGDAKPGEYRKNAIVITGSAHIPPKPTELGYYMEELIEFINEKDNPKYDLLKIALAHHRFVWIHPFGNGNGRTVRLITYAQLVRAGFKVDVGGRIINPTAVFCSDREKYHSGLATADPGTQEGLLAWSQYVLTGLRDEIEKIDRLTDYDYLSEMILLPAIEYTFQRKLITELEKSILIIAVKKEGFKAPDVKHLFPGKSAPHISRFISCMREKKLIVPEKKNGRTYMISFGESYVLRGVIEMLGKEDFLPPDPKTR